MQDFPDRAGVRLGRAVGPELPSGPVGGQEK